MFAAPEGTFETNVVDLYYLSTWHSIYEHSVRFSSKVMVNGKGPRKKRKKCVSPSYSGAIVTRPLSVVDLKAEIDKLATEYMSSARNLSSEEKLALLKQIQEAYGKCKEFGDDKVQLAMQTYEMVWPCS